MMFLLYQPGVWGGPFIAFFAMSGGREGLWLGLARVCVEVIRAAGVPHSCTMKLCMNGPPRRWW